MRIVAWLTLNVGGAGV